jgi:hypothetical protein
VIVGKYDSKPGIWQKCSAAESRDNQMNVTIRCQVAVVALTVKYMKSVKVKQPFDSVTRRLSDGTLAQNGRFVYENLPF